MIKGWQDKGFTLASVGDGTNRGDANAILVDPLFKEAKSGNKKSAALLWRREWERGSSENITRLKLALEEGKIPVFISVPGTSKKNQIPPTAAEFWPSNRVKGHALSTVTGIFYPFISV